MNYLLTIILISYGLSIIGILIREFALAGISSILMMSLGVYILINGISGFSNLATLALGIVSVCVGFYIIARGAYEIYNEM